MSDLASKNERITLFQSNNLQADFSDNKITINKSASFAQRSFKSDQFLRGSNHISKTSNECVRFCGWKFVGGSVCLCMGECMREMKK